MLPPTVRMLKLLKVTKYILLDDYKPNRRPEFITSLVENVETEKSLMFGKREERIKEGITLPQPTVKL